MNHWYYPSVGGWTAWPTARHPSPICNISGGPTIQGGRGLVIGPKTYLLGQLFREGQAASQDDVGSMKHEEGWSINEEPAWWVGWWTSIRRASATTSLHESWHENTVSQSTWIGFIRAPHEAPKQPKKGPDSKARQTFSSHECLNYFESWLSVTSWIDHYLLVS